MLRNGLLRYILHTCPKLYITRVQSATEWTASSAPIRAPTCIDVARHRETWIKFIDVARHRETSIESIDVVVVALVCAHPPPTCIDVYRRRETSRDIDKIYRRRETLRDIEKNLSTSSSSSSPWSAPIRLVQSPTSIDVYRRRETSRDIDKIYRRRRRRRRRRPGLRPSASDCTYIDVYRRRETSRDIDKIYRRRETSRDIDKIYRRRETSIKNLYPYSFFIGCWGATIFKNDQKLHDFPSLAIF